MANSKTMLITGATGFIGSCLIHKLVDTNVYDIHIIKRKQSNIWRIKNILDYVSIHDVDIIDYTKLRKVIKSVKPDLIFHTATYGGYPFQKDINKIIQTNIIGTINLVNVCAEVGFDAFINTGSSSEYGLKDKPIQETDLPEPISEYGVAKEAATLFCQAKAKKERLPIVTLRLFSPYGYYEEPTRLIPSVIKSCLLNKNPKVSSPHSVRDFIFVEDVVNAYIKAINFSSSSGEVFNIGYGQQHSVGYVVNKIIRLTGDKVKPEWGSIPKRSNEPTSWQADISKAKDILHWKPKYSIEHGLKKTIEWFEKNISLYTQRE
ncbi:MAG: NAD-dependent dehydratase [Thermoplasmata archaeon]|nr:MAG: NAD-dependent dehydratase [Thermoplasmata archaeon]